MKLCQGVGEGEGLINMTPRLYFLLVAQLRFNSIF